jgi:uncharacterized membrane protein YeaQ/YmgE (transglycosylase-associated protein family)
VCAEEFAGFDGHEKSEREVRVMFEHIVQMGPMLVLAGLIAGWIAEAAARAGGYGFMVDMGVGLVGSVVGGSIVWVLISGDVGMPAMLAIGCGGAALAIAGQRRLWRSGPLGP